MKIIGVAGPARAGKDTVGDYLVKYRGFKRFAFADPMKDMICALLGWHRNELEARKDDHIPSIGYSPRELLQTIGTEWGRDTLNKDFWVDATFRQIAELSEATYIGVVITDCRFPNEATRIRQGGVVCHVSRTRAPEVAAHVSEAGVDMQGNDYKIQNEGSLDDLHVEVDHMLRMYDKLIRLGGH